MRIVKYFLNIFSYTKHIKIIGEISTIALKVGNIQDKLN